MNKIYLIFKLYKILNKYLIKSLEIKYQHDMLHKINIIRSLVNYFNNYNNSKLSFFEIEKRI